MKQVSERRCYDGVICRQAEVRQLEAQLQQARDRIEALERVAEKRERVIDKQDAEIARLRKITISVIKGQDETRLWLSINGQVVGIPFPVDEEYTVELHPPLGAAK